jgi:arylsulfatase A-like enzyme
MQDLLNADELPSLKRFIVEPGAGQTATTVFPSTTGPAHAPFITGCTPGTCDIPGIRWFDRQQPHGMTHFHQSRSYVGPGSLYMDADLRPGIRTIFEYFQRPAGVFSFLNRGMGLFENRTLLSKSWYWFYAHYTGHWQAVDDAAWRYIARALDRDADFIFAVFPAVDEHSHHTHPFSELTLASYRAVDRAFGRLAERMHRQGRLEDTLFVLSSDHGLTATHTHFELWEALNGCGLNTLYYPKILRNGCTAASMISGNGMAHVYLKKGTGWETLPAYREIREGHYGGTDLIEALLAREAVDLVAVRSEEDGIVVCSRQGMAELRDTGAAIEYRIMDGDPFGYTALLPRMTYEESLELTFDTDYPDAPYQLLKLLGSSRSGDMIVSARKGYDLRWLHEHPEHKASHGSLHRDHMHVPLLLNADIARPYVRTTDVFPSMLELMGHLVTDPIDGQSFVSPLQMEGVNA